MWIEFRYELLKQIAAKSNKMGKKNKLNPDHKFTLFIKLSRRIPNSINIRDSVNEMYSNVLDVRKPRQKSSRWLLCDFETTEYAEEFKKILVEKKSIANIKVKTNKLSIKERDPSDKPENERQQRTNSLTKQSFQSKSLEKYSPKLLVTQLPENVTTDEIAELFPNHLSLDLKRSPKLRAIITYSSAKEAMAARMNVRPIIDGQKIRVILLLLEDNNRKRKASDSEPAATSKEVPTETKKPKKREPHAFIKPLRYFDAEALAEVE